MRVDLALGEDAAVLRRPQRLDVVVELEIRRCREGHRSHQPGHRQGRPRLPGGDPRQPLDAEREDVQPRRALPFAVVVLAPADHRRHQEEDGEKAEQHPRSDDQSHLVEAGEVGDQEGIERRGGGDGAEHHPARRRATHRAHRFDDRATALPLLDITSIEHDDEIVSQTDEQRRDSRGRRGEHADGERGEPEGDRQAAGERPEDQQQQRGAAVGDVEQDQHAEDRGQRVDHDVPPDEPGVAQNDHVAAAEEDLRHGSVAAFRQFAPAGAHGSDGLLHRFEESAIEIDVLGWVRRLAENQHQPVVARQVPATRPVDGQGSALPAEAVEEDARNSQRIELDQILERHRLRHLEGAPQLPGAIADRRPAQLSRQALPVRPVEEEHRPGQELAQQFLRLADRRLDGAEVLLRLAHPQGDVVRERFVRVERCVLGNANADHEVVDVAELLERFAEGDDARVLVRQQVQHVRVETQAEGERRAPRDDHEEDQEDQPVAPAGEEDQAFEHPARGQAGTGGCGGAGGRCPPAEAFKRRQ